jgi:protoporphyrinogen IX oxidase
MTAETRTWVMRAVIALAVTGALTVGLFLWNPSHLNLWIKSVHVLAIISWMAGMLYLPRLFVYHCGAEIGSVQSETFKVMERRLLVAITNPAMIVSWVTGAWLAWDVGYLRDGWFHGKLLLVVLLSGVHGMLSRYTRDFAHDRNRHSHKFYRFINEVPTLLMIGIVILVIAKPF